MKKKEIQNPHDQFFKAYDEILNEGLQRGSQQMALSLLEKKFGKLDSQTNATVKQLSTDKLKELRLALFDLMKTPDICR